MILSKGGRRGSRGDAPANRIGKQNVKRQRVLAASAPRFAKASLVQKPVSRHVKVLVLGSSSLLSLSS
jgi:hypothetical protein